MRYLSTKTYGHELGLSVCFRQHKADSHCRFLHGYALSFEFVFGSNKLDNKGWVVDFGGTALKQLKTWLQQTFDHTLMVAEDDPELELMLQLGDLSVADVFVVSGVGCESFAKLALRRARDLIDFYHPGVKVISCKVSEHGTNSATVLEAAS